MSLITRRPKYWNGVVGQDRAVKVLQALLTSNKFLLRGFIFEGVRGVGKTTTAYIHSQALMCLGIDPLGCAAASIPCPSCRLIETKGIDQHPDFREVDAASNSGVEAARAILDQAQALPILGKRRVTMIDEAHRLSREAWDVYLKPLEAGDTDTIFIFITNSPEKIPGTIRSRCCRLPFARVAEDTILGLLSAISGENKVTYEMEALRLIAKTAKGRVRDAVKMLDVVAAMGSVTVALVQSQLETTLEDGVADLYKMMLARKQKEAVFAIDSLSRVYSPSKIIEKMFGFYAKAVFTEELTDIMLQFGDVPTMTSFFMKWSSVQGLSSDVLPLFLYELSCIRDPRLPGARRDNRHYSAAPTPSLGATPSKHGILTPDEAARLMGAKIEED